MSITLEGWLLAKREEARRLFLADYRAWLKTGAFPLPVYSNGRK